MSLRPVKEEPAQRLCSGQIPQNRYLKRTTLGFL
jgi:hypothetical protein